MDVFKRASIASIGATSAAPGPLGRGVPGQTAARDFASANETSAALDRVDIGPLSLAGALQILIAEVREALAADLPVSPSSPSSSYAPQGPDLAAHRLVELYLQAVSVDEGREPETGDWLARLERIDACTDAGFARALQVVGAWREVTPAVIASLQEVRGLVASALAMDESIGNAPDVGVLATGVRDPINPAWLLRPEWLRLAPRLDRFRRLRRKMRRSVRDPDARDPTLPYA
jgi:hypothetical protein